MNIYTHSRQRVEREQSAHVEKLISTDSWEQEFKKDLIEENRRFFRMTQDDIREMVKLRDRLPAEDQISRDLIGECIELQMESLRELQRTISGKAGN